MTTEEIFAGESDNIEFKVDIPSRTEKYMKTVVAFANGAGGRLIFGVENGTWDIVGFSKEKVFQKIDAITNAIYDSCEPKITPDVAIQEIDGKAIIVVEILPGMQKPYCIQSQGPVDGVYVRVAGTTRHAERYQIQELILEGTNRSFDQMEKEAVLSDAEIDVFCEQMYQHALSLCTSDEMRAQLRKVTRNQLVSWKVIAERNGIYHPTNAYLLLDGCSEEFPEATIQCAVFKGVVRDIFITRKEFAGPIYQQIEDAYHFVLQHINVGSRIEGIARQDFYELPIKTIREMISNAVCHRSYLTPGKIQVALFDDRLEVTSPGMLDNELTIEKMKSGLSKIRNKGIAAAFSYMNVIEAWGTGIPKMLREAKEYGLREPEMIDMGGDFRINLFRKEAEVDENGVINPKSAANGITSDATNETKYATDETNLPSGAMTTIVFSENERLLVSAIRTNAHITQKQLHEVTGIALGTIKRLLPKLQEKGVIERIGNRRSGIWAVKE